MTALVSLDCSFGLSLKILGWRLGSLAEKYELHAAFFAPNNDDSISSKTFRYQWRRDIVVGTNCVTRLSLALMFHDVEIIDVSATWKSCCEV